MSIQINEGATVVSQFFSTTPTPSYTAAIGTDTASTARQPFTIGFFAKMNLTNLVPASSNSGSIDVSGGFQNASDPSFSVSYSSYEDGETPQFGAVAKGNGTSRLASTLGDVPAHNSNERWFFVVAQYSSNNFRGITVIDPSDGAILKNALDGQSAAGFNRGNILGLSLRLGRSNLQPKMVIAEIVSWREVVPITELQAFAQVGFAATNRPANLLQDINFIYNWQNTGAANEVEDRGPHGMDVVLPTDPNVVYVTDSPVPVFIVILDNLGPSSADYSLFSVQPGTGYLGAWPAGTPRPSDEDIVAGIDAVTTVSGYMDGVNNTNVSLPLADTGTTYEIYGVQDINDAGTDFNSYTGNVTSPTKYSQNVASAAGDRWVNKTGIRWAWFDDIEPQNFSSPAAKGSGESVDSDGLLEITLPSSISTPKGSRGTMVLYATFDDGEQTAYHPVTVK